MATLGNYFIDTSNFATATAVWTDATFLTKAADGWYQSCGIVREQSGGFLLPVVACPVCRLDCDDGTPGRCATLGGVFQGDFVVPFTEVNGGGGGQGAVKVTIRTTGLFLPIGAFITYDGTTYSEVVSSNFGFLAGPFVGDIATFVPYGFPTGSPYSVATYTWGDITCDNFIPTGGASTLNIPAADADGVAGDPGDLVLFIPKPNGDPNEMEIRVAVPVGGNDATWEITNECVATLTSLSVTDVFVSSVAACGQPLNNTFYNGPVNGAAGVPGLYDVMFTDEDAVEKLADAVGFGAGFYHYIDGVNKWFEIDANSVIVSLGNC